jgi:hypothetical protein
MSIVQKSDFVDEVEIANWAKESIGATVDRFIAKYEPLFLSYLMKSDFKNEFISGLAENPVLLKWDILSDVLKPAIVNFIYVKYQYWLDTQTTGNGEGKLQSANAVNVSAVSKVVERWNEMVDIVRALHSALNAVNYPTYEPPYPNAYNPYSWHNYEAYNCPEIYIKINSFGI